MKVWGWFAQHLIVWLMDFSGSMYLVLPQMFACCMKDSQKCTSCVVFSQGFIDVTPKCPNFAILFNRNMNRTHTPYLELFPLSGQTFQAWDSHLL